MKSVTLPENLETSIPTKAKRQRGYSAYQPTTVWGLDRIPAHWREKPLKRLVRINTDKLSDTTDPDHEIEYVDIGNVTLEKGITTTEQLRFEVAPSRARRLVREGDTIVSTVRTYLKAVAQITNQPNNLVVSTGFAVIRPSSEIDAGFLYRLIQSEAFVSRIMAKSVGVSYPAINASDIGTFPVQIPPLDEQRAIAKFLDLELAKIDELIAKKQRLIELLHIKRKGLISRAVTKGLNPNAHTIASGVDWLGDVPEHWKVRAFRYSARIRNGQVDPELPIFRDLPLIAPNHIESETGRLLEYGSAAEQSAESGKYLFEEGNVLYSKIRPALAKVCIAPVRGLCSADMYPITPRDDLRAKYLMYFMLSEEFTTGVVLLSARVAMPKMNRRDLGGFVITVPPIEEQDVIVQFLDTEIAKIDRTREYSQKAIEKISLYRSALISAVVTGQIDVRNYRPEAPCQ